MTPTPSEHFIASIQIAFRKAQKVRRPVKPADLWDELVFMCIAETDGFTRMFAWDKQRTARRNRIGTIRDVIAAGYAPGLRLGIDSGGRTIVEESEALV